MDDDAGNPGHPSQADLRFADQPERQTGRSALAALLQGQGAAFPIVLVLRGSPDVDLATSRRIYSVRRISIPTSRTSRRKSWAARSRQIREQKLEHSLRVSGRHIRPCRGRSPARHPRKARIRWPYGISPHHGARECRPGGAPSRECLAAHLADAADLSLSRCPRSCFSWRLNTGRPSSSSGRRSTIGTAFGSTTSSASPTSRRSCTTRPSCSRSRTSSSSSFSI